MEEIIKKLLENPEAIVPLAQVYIEKYKPTVYGLLQELVKVYADYANNEEFRKLEAKALWNDYSALKEVGFTDDQAMTLLLNSQTRAERNLNSINDSLKSMNKKG